MIFDLKHIKEYYADSSYICWKCEDRTKRISFNDLKLEIVGFGHLDFNCPKCGKTIICINKLGMPR